MAKHPRNEFTIEQLREMPLAQLDSLLTHKEWAFVEARLNGYTRRHAYKIAYPDCKAKDRVVDSKAYEVGQRDVVRVSFERHLEELKNDKFNAAFLRGIRAGKELEDIAYGVKKFKIINEDGEEIEVPPTPGQIFAALKEIRRDSVEMLKNESAAENGLNNGIVTVVIKGFDED